MAQQSEQQFTLVKASKSRPTGEWGDDDYDVRLGDASGSVIGRIFRASQWPQYWPWFWTITARLPQRPTERGYAATCKFALKPFKQAWLNSRPHAKVSPDFYR